MIAYNSTSSKPTNGLTENEAIDATLAVNDMLAHRHLVRATAADPLAEFHELFADHPEGVTTDNAVETLCGDWGWDTDYLAERVNEAVAAGHLRLAYQDGDELVLIPTHRAVQP